ncbi:hypothetical protein MAUB1S_08465 [Mycolicibacterium aubagnense]
MAALLKDLQAYSAQGLFSYKALGIEAQNNRRVHNCFILLCVSFNISLNNLSELMAQLRTMNYVVSLGSVTKARPFPSVQFTLKAA